MLPRRLKQLEANLNSGTTEQRLETITELGNARQEYALELLYRTANGDNTTLRDAAQRAFALFAKNNPRTAMRHPTTLIRHEAAFVLGSNRVRDSIDELARVTRNDSEELMRLVCVQALGNINDSACVPGLRGALHDRSVKVREAAFNALRSIGGSTVEVAVADLLDDHDWELRLKAHALLQSTGWFPTTRQQKASWAIAEGRFDGVVSQLPEAIEPLLIATLRVNDVASREWAARALFRSGSEEARRKLRGALTHSNPEVRLRAAEALTFCGESAAQWINIEVAPASSKSQRPMPPNAAFRAATWMLSLLGHP